MGDSDSACSSFAEFKRKRKSFFNMMEEDTQPFVERASTDRARSGRCRPRRGLWAKIFTLYKIIFCIGWLMSAIFVYILIKLHSNITFTSSGGENP